MIQPPGISAETWTAKFGQDASGFGGGSPRYRGNPTGLQDFRGGFLLPVFPWHVPIQLGEDQLLHGIRCFILPVEPGEGFFFFRGKPPEVTPPVLLIWAVIAMVDLRPELLHVDAMIEAYPLTGENPPPGIPRVVQEESRRVYGSCKDGAPGEGALPPAIGEPELIILGSKKSLEAGKIRFFEGGLQFPQLHDPI